jgi:hypothetical protein
VVLSSASSEGSCAGFANPLLSGSLFTSDGILSGPFRFPVCLINSAYPRFCCRYISGDNGTSTEGTTLGTPFDIAALQGIEVPVADQLKFYDVWGSPQTTPHMAVPWSWAFDTPFKWTKQVASHFGGTPGYADYASRVRHRLVPLGW